MKSLIVIFFVISAVFFNNCFAESSCDMKSVPLDFKSKVATANLWDNYRNNDGSIAKESSEMLKSSIEYLNGKDLQPEACSRNAQILFYSIPAKFLNDYSDKEYCESFLKKTKEAPIKYSSLNFKDIEEFSAWFNELSQGKGKLGKELYSKCDRDCSPQYKSIILRVPAGIKADVEVICGPARDKDDNNYNLSVKHSFGSN